MIDNPAVTLAASIVVAGVMLVPHLIGRWNATHGPASDPLNVDPEVGLAVNVFRAYVESDGHRRTAAMLEAASRVPAGVDPARAIARGIIKVGSARSVMQRAYPKGLPVAVRESMADDDGRVPDETEVVSTFLTILTVLGLTVPGM